MLEYCITAVERQLVGDDFPVIVRHSFLLVIQYLQPRSEITLYE